MRADNRFGGDRNGIVRDNSASLGSDYSIDGSSTGEALLVAICSIRFASRLLLPMPPGLNDPIVRYCSHPKTPQSVLDTSEQAT